MLNELAIDLNKLQNEKNTVARYRNNVIRFEPQQVLCSVVDAVIIISPPPPPSPSLPPPPSSPLLPHHTATLVKLISKHDTFKGSRVSSSELLRPPSLLLAPAKPPRRPSPKQEKDAPF